MSRIGVAALNLNACAELPPRSGSILKGGESRKYNAQFLPCRSTRFRSPVRAASMIRLGHDVRDDRAATGVMEFNCMRHLNGREVIFDDLATRITGEARCP